MFKCLELILPGKNQKFLIFLLTGLIFNHYQLYAQADSLIVSFSEGSRLLISQNWDRSESNFNLNEDVSPDLERKSPSRAFFYSLLLPGSGEAYVGSEFQSRLFLGIEIIGWGLVIANMINVNTRESDYKNYAVQHANVLRQGKEDQYWIDIGKFDNLFEFNEERRRDRDIAALYPENGYYNWQWDKNETRLNYDAYRIETREIENDRLYFFAAIALNHLVSAINALRLANSYNRKQEKQSMGLGFNYNPRVGEFSFSIQKSF
jgi:hypothetical protein